MLTLEDLVSKTTDLPTFPAAALAVMREADSPTSTASSIARHLAQDQALSARVLRLSNSAFYGLSRQVGEIQEAVVVLGMRCIRNLAMIASTYPWMSRAYAGYDLGPQAMWTHSFAVAAGAQLVARRSGKADGDSAFTAGLLHDLGKVVLSVWLEGKLHAMQLLAIRDQQTFDHVERRILGYDHAEVGAHLADTWNLPKNLVNAIRHHHHPNDLEGGNSLVDCVHVADYLTMSMGYGLGGDGLRYEFQAEALQRLGLSEEDVDELTAEFIDAYNSYEQLFSVVKAAA